MVEDGNSKRSFFKKMVAAIGLFAGANYVRKVVAARSPSVRDINAKSTNEDDMQRKAWLEQQQVLMTDGEKKQMLDDILNLHNKYNA